MKFLILIAIAAVTLIPSQLARSQGSRARPVGSTVRVERCNAISIRTFLGGWSQGAIDFTCREVSMGPTVEILVYLNDPSDCGTGGCTLLALTPSVERGYNVVGDIRTVRAPIRVLKTKTHGLFDLVGFVAGGGIIPGYNAKLTYDGKSYPPGGSSGAEIPPGGSLGTVVISAAMAAHPQVMQASGRAAIESDPLLAGADEPVGRGGDV